MEWDEAVGRLGGVPGRAGAAAGFLGLLSLSLSIALWTVKGSPIQCPDCNCGDEANAQLGTQEEDAETTLGMGVALFAIILILCALTSYYLEKSHIIAFPDCIAFVLFGIVIGTVLRLTGGSTAAGYVLPNQEQLFLFVLPPILFEAGYSINVTDFFSQAASILTFAVLGTAISSLVFGLSIWGIGLSGASYHFSFFEALTFGALISAVDPVSTINVFTSLKVNKTLHFLVFGESTINDAASIVMYRTFQGFITADTTPTWYVPIASFLFIFLGSTVIGCVTGVGAALLLKHTELYRNPTLEFTIYAVMAYLPYFMCEGLHLSGIMGILTSGMVLAHYAHKNLGRVTQIASQQAFKMISNLAEMFIFVYLGTALTTFQHRWHPLTIMWAIILTLISRAANVFPLSLWLNRYREDKISSKNQFIMWFSGIRGAISFALSLNFSGASEETRQVVTSTTLVVVLFTIIVLGGGTFPLLNLLGVEGEPRADPAGADRRPSPDEPEEGNAESSGNMYTRARHLFATGSRMNAFQRLDDEYFKPIFLAQSRTSGSHGLRQIANADHVLTPHEMTAVLETEPAHGPDGMGSNGSNTPESEMQGLTNDSRR